MIELPTEPHKGDDSKISKMLIISRPKLGKTQALMQLPNSLLIDTDGSSQYYDGMSMNIPTLMAQEGKGMIATIKTIQKMIKDKNTEAGGFAYKYGIIDTVTMIEDACDAYATYNYKKSAQGQNFEGKSVVAELEYGAGYLWLRKAWDEVINPFFELFETVIFVGHIRDSSLNIQGKSLSVADLALTGKIKLSLTSKCDAIGTLYRSSDDEYLNVLSFKTDASDIITGARPKHLSGNEIEISRMDPASKELTTYWNKVFLDIE